MCFIALFLSLGRLWRSTWHCFTCMTSHKTHPHDGTHTHTVNGNAAEAELTMQELSLNTKAKLPPFLSCKEECVWFHFVRCLCCRRWRVCVCVHMRTKTLLITETDGPGQHTLTPVCHRGETDWWCSSCEMCYASFTERAEKVERGGEKGGGSGW